MASSRVSLKSFLATARKALSTPAGQRPSSSSHLTFVVGNESADLDSLCSALLYAYFRTHTPPHALHIPLSNLPRADFALRPELAAVCRSAGLTPSDLITLSDLPHDSRTGQILLNPDSTRWLLVDHNVLNGTLAPFSKQVIGCIDHHEDEDAVPHNCSPRVFARCGSCMSLVIDQCKDIWSALPPSAEDDASLAAVALAAILTDTTNLMSKDKTTECDLKAAKLAESKLVSGSSAVRIHLDGGDSEGRSGGYDRTKYFDLLTRLKDDINGLSYRDILRKDYKRWSDGGLSLGVSTVVQGLDKLLTLHGDDGKKGFLEALKGWAKEQKLHIAAVMTISRPGGVFTRELLVWGLNEQAIKVLKQFVKKSGEELRLKSWREGEMDDYKDEGEKGKKQWRVCWRQENVRHSRKQVAPMLREAMKESSRL